MAGTTPFTRTDLEFLAAVANQLAVQLHNREHVATLEAEVERLQARPLPERAALVWKDPLMQEVDAFIAAGRRHRPCRSLILVRGESGSVGKELVARSMRTSTARAAATARCTVVACAGAATDAERRAARPACRPTAKPRPGS